VTSTRSLLRWQLRVAHDLLEAAFEAAGGEAVDGRPAGPLARAAIRCAELLVGEDLTVNGVLARKHPLALTSWAGRTGISELPPPGALDREAWFRRVRLDVSRLRSYALAVRTATDDYLAGLPDRDLDPSQAELLTALLLELAARRGEVDWLLCRPPVV
jgi:hypothetical protein